MFDRLAGVAPSRSVRMPIEPELLTPLSPEWAVVRKPIAARPHRKLRAFAASLLIHLTLAALFLVVLPLASKGEPAPRRVIQSVLIVRAAAQDSAPAAAPAMPVQIPSKEAAPPEPAREPPPKPVESTKPAPAQPKPAATPPAPPATARTEPATAARETATAPPVERSGNQGDSSLTLLLNQVRENWLQPAGSKLLFRCRIKIDFLVGGIISKVSVLQGCGDSPLDDSVIRAIWKTQPLPIESARLADGSVVLEFTP